MTNTASSDLAEQINLAHARHDLTALVRLYSKAAEISRAAGDIDKASFLLTYAWIYALDVGSAEADGLRQQLIALGRDIEDSP